MTRWWDIQIDKGIALTKMRIKKLEKHGGGQNIMKEKRILQEQERHKLVRKQNVST